MKIILNVAMDERHEFFPSLTDMDILDKFRYPPLLSATPKTARPIPILNLKNVNQ